MACPSGCSSSGLASTSGRPWAPATAPASAGDLKLARLDLGQGLQGVLPLKPGAGLARGATVEVETASEARGDKAAASG